MDYAAAVGSPAAPHVHCKYRHINHYPHCPINSREYSHTWTQQSATHTVPLTADSTHIHGHNSQLTTLSRQQEMDPTDVPKIQYVLPLTCLVYQNWTSCTCHIYYIVLKIILYLVSYGSHTCPDRPWGQPSLPYSGYWVFPGGKEAGRGVDHPPQSSAEVKERVELYLYSTSGSLWPVVGWTLFYMGLKTDLSLHENTYIEGFWGKGAGKERKNRRMREITLQFLNLCFFHLILLQY